LNITVIIPTYNEAENIPKIVSALLLLPLPGLRVLVADDNSPDGTGHLVDQIHATEPRVSALHRKKKVGLGRAYLDAFQVAMNAGADYLVQMDADFSHPPEKILEMAEKIDGYDLVIGSRYVEGGSLDENWPIWRKRLSAFGNGYARTILNMPIRDCTGGFRMYRRETLQGMPLERVRSNGYVFQVEMAYLGYRKGFKALEIPIHFADRQWGTSKMNLRVQAEAALRVWQVWRTYRDLY
jgi:dolichol-phosphate mannosyltransferase